MFFEGVAEEDGGFMSTLPLVPVVLLGFGWRCARRVGAVRWIRTFLAPPKLASTDSLDVRKREFLVVVEVIQDLVTRSTKGDDVEGLEGSQKHGLENVINGEIVHVAKGLAGFANFLKVGVDGAL
jgi:hypothetical protein